MKTRIFFAFGLLIPVLTFAQFQTQKSIPITGAAQTIQWMDINNDSLLDAVILLKKNAYFQLVAINKITTDSAKTFLLADSLPSNTVPTFLDWDGDNKMDIVFPQTSVPNSLLLKNLGDFKFKKTSLSIGNSTYSKIQFADLNNDSQPEAVVIKNSGGWSILKNNQGQYSLTLDSTQKAENFALFDFDGNGFRDLALCGTSSNGQAFLSVYEFYNNFELRRKIQVHKPIRGKIEIGDVNEDGFFDLLVSGKDSIGQYVSQVYLNHDSTFIASKKLVGLQNAELRIADLDSDGKADLSLFGLDGQGILHHWISSATGDSIALPTQHITHQVYGDFDRDGDLDLLLSTDTLSVVVLENKTVAKNLGPTASLNSFGLFIFSRYFMYWDKSVDDHTPSPALTYDLTLLNGQKELGNGEFDLNNLERLTVTHGNQGTNNFTLQRIPISSYSYFLQSIDNSFTTKNRSTCRGQGGGNCINLSIQTLTSCNSAPIHFQTPQPVLWFSFSKGFLGKTDSLSISTKIDTIFSYSPAKTFSCSNLKVFLIQKSASDTVKVTKNFKGCVGDATVLTVGSEWAGIIWKDLQGLQKGIGDSLHYVISKNETLIAIGHNDHGCIIRETENLKASKPTLTLNGEDFKIMQGQSVSISASGAVEYWWQPAEGLSNNTSPNPEASPTKTTSYTLTGFDSLRCTSTATVLIEVTNTAFVPTLFTPNGDGKNDELKIYGLNNGNDFQFTVYNREGSTVYETSDLGSATATGWNGTKNGVTQPSGLYYWKVEGHFDNGQPLTLNGKTKGSIMLIR